MNLTLAFLFLISLPRGVREVTATSCEVIRLNVALGMTSQLIFDEPPTLTLHADEEHFKVKTTPEAKRSIAIIPFVDSATLAQLFQSRREENVIIPSPRVLAERLDAAYHTNLFVFFKNSNQLMFELRFVEKPKVDFILNVRQAFRKDCQL
ncbi:MAG: hypothetical protein JWQ35_2124 [Bacteriovoracaceae bacterium]|nr:hypothetical protein [Bacteriovoracaceae bacterium]